MTQPPDSPEPTCDDMIARLEEQLTAAQETIKELSWDGALNDAETKIKHLEETIVAQQARIAELDAGIYKMANTPADTYSNDSVWAQQLFNAARSLYEKRNNNLSALHENNARVLEEAAEFYEPSVMRGHEMYDMLMRRAAEYRAKAGG